MRCSLYCATDGDAGRSSGIPVSSREELGASAARSCRAACDVLGVRTLDQRRPSRWRARGGGPDVVIGEIVALLRRERPRGRAHVRPRGRTDAASRPPRHLPASPLPRSCSPGQPRRFPSSSRTGWRRIDRRSYGTPPGARRRRARSPPPRDSPSTSSSRLPSGCRQKRAAFEAHRSQHVHRANFERLALRSRSITTWPSGRPRPLRQCPPYVESTSSRPHLPQSPCPASISRASSRSFAVIPPASCVVSVSVTLCSGYRCRDDDSPPRPVGRRDHEVDPVQKPGKAVGPNSLHPLQLFPYLINSLRAIRRCPWKPCGALKVRISFCGRSDWRAV